MDMNHGAWTFTTSKQKMMCLLDMDVFVRDTGEDRRLQFKWGNPFLLQGARAWTVISAQ
jgi:hypothetical protein